jgi:threonine synthase
MQSVQYISTRGDKSLVKAKEAIVRGIAHDGGLFYPADFPEPISQLEDLIQLSYQGLAYKIMKPFLTDFTETELLSCIENAYDDKFSTPAIAPMVNRAGVYFLELFHGPTLAFKDMALTILPHLLKTAARGLRLEREIVILTATSGDTGKAALEGFANIQGTKIIVFFPKDGVSEIQRRQMVTQLGDNTHVIGIKGNFDAAQRGVKEIFADQALSHKMASAGKIFSSANSINIGRLLPQVVYYFYAYAQLCRSNALNCGEEVNFTVPTGNFGNILAGYFARQMGLPIKKLICASNDNKILFDFFTSNKYDSNREFFTTISPSMDILISSNLERLLFAINDKNGGQTSLLMKQLQEEGQYSITSEMAARLHPFRAGFTTEAETKKTIRGVYEQDRYLMDPHTAVAYAVSRHYQENTKDTTPMVVVSTASPYKFAHTVMTALTEKYASFDEFRLIAEMAALLKEEIPRPIRDLQKRPIRHKMIWGKEEMKPLLEKLLLNR